MRCLALLAVVLLAGCATTPPPPPQQVRVLTDTRCRSDSEITWSKNDTPETIDKIRRHNGGYRGQCKR